LVGIRPSALLGDAENFGYSQNFLGNIDFRQSIPYPDGIPDLKIYFPDNPVRSGGDSERRLVRDQFRQVIVRRDTVTFRRVPASQVRAFNPFSQFRQNNF
jgi:hypothetical protein